MVPLQPPLLQRRLSSAIKANRRASARHAPAISNAPATYRRRRFVFNGIDFFQVSLYLFLGRYNWLARHFVPYQPAPPTKPPSSRSCAAEQHRSIATLLVHAAA